MAVNQRKDPKLTEDMENFLSSIKWDNNNLVPVIVQVLSQKFNFPHLYLNFNKTTFIKACRHW